MHDERVSSIKVAQLLMTLTIYTSDENKSGAPKIYELVASDESILLSHMGPPKSAIKSLIFVVEQFCI